MNTKITNFKMLIALMAIMILATTVIVYAASSVVPYTPTSMEYVSNSTKAQNNQGTAQNLTKGYIHTINITEKQPTFKWVGIVGKVSGKYALQDADNLALYDWTITTVTGKVIATRHTSVPNWDNMKCSDANNLTQEQAYLNHSIAYGASANEDSMTNTFLGTTAANFDSFYIGQQAQIVPGANCMGVNLNVNDAHTDIGKNWSEIIVSDNGYSDNVLKLYYVGKIQNRTLGYRNDQYYDFQLLLPQSGLPTAVNTAYFFYVELV